MLQTFMTNGWDDYFPDSNQKIAIQSIEDGDVLFFPNLAFDLLPNEVPFLNPAYADPKSKNISFQKSTQKLWGVQHLDDAQHLKLKAMLDRYAKVSYNLIKTLLPHYSRQVVIGRTSFRPVEVSNRHTSYRKDDKRLHVDAFPSAPNQGQRILRVFTNINPIGEERIWRLGESFEKVAKRFSPHVKNPVPGWAGLLRLLRITKSYRTLYDHYMLALHDQMKIDTEYQSQALQQEVRFPSGSSWIVMTDKTSHAAMAGQYVLEQTFYLPIKAMLDESKSPLYILENVVREKLI